MCWQEATGLDSRDKDKMRSGGKPAAVPRRDERAPHWLMNWQMFKT